MTDIASVKPAPPATSTPAAGVSTFQGPARAPAVPSTPEHLQKQLDAAIADSDTSLRFRVDRDAGRIVVAVLDHDGALILQIPSETALAIARRLAATGSLLDVRA
jgi:uncharacterized FlaG/YvyC family protein